MAIDRDRLHAARQIGQDRGGWRMAGHQYGGGSMIVFYFNEFRLIVAARTLTLARCKPTTTIFTLE